MKKKKIDLFKRWLQKQFEKNPEKIRRCPDCNRKINKKRYSVWYGVYKCKCGWKIDGIILKIKRKEL